MAGISDTNATDNFDQTLVVLKGGTDNTSIGNSGDSLKVTGTLVTTLPDNSSIDAFGRSRVSEAKCIFNSSFIVDKDPELWAELTATGGTSTSNTNRACVDMAVTTTSGSKVYRQTRRAFRYIGGLSKIHYQTFVFNAAKTGLRQRIGAFDDDDGVFLELTGTTVNIVLRSKVTGSVVDTAVPQASWNGDKLNGSGASGVTLDLTKGQILWIDMQWLGVGRIRVGTVHAGLPIIMHSFLNSNIISNVYTQSAQWHLRAEIENIATTASSSTMQHICSSILLEGNEGDQFGRNRTANTGTTKRTATKLVDYPVISIRPLAVGSILPNIIAESFTIDFTTSNDVLYKVIINGTLTGASWVSNSTGAEKDISATAITGGTTILSGYYSSAGNAQTILIPFDNLLALGHDLSNVMDICSLIVNPINANGDAYASIDYKELY